MNGTMKPAIASLSAVKPVCMGEPPDRPAAAKAASATGGVMFAKRPK